LWPLVREELTPSIVGVALISYFPVNILNVSIMSPLTVNLLINAGSPINAGSLLNAGGYLSSVRISARGVY